jgi:opacity protein-like surface antigen
MKVQIACVTVLAAVAVGSQAASAADFGKVMPGGVVNGGIKDYGGVGGVPVPAPVPVQDERPSFYFRLDGGYGIQSDPSISESGYKFGGLINGDKNFIANGVEGASAPTLMSNNPSWLSTDFSDLATFGAGVGYYAGHGFRMDATVEGRSRSEVTIDGSKSWTSMGYGDTDNNPLTPDVLTSDLNGDANAPGGHKFDRTTYADFKDKTTVTGSIWMANVYYDLMSGAGRSFTPYVGAGVGVVWNELQRTHTTTITSKSNTPPCDCQTEYTSSTTTKADTVSLAAAAMAGVTYQVSDMTSIDLGYRYLFLGGSEFDTTIDGFKSHMSISDQNVHQLRAGLRFDVN